MESGDWILRPPCSDRELCRGEHPDRGVSSLAVVPDLDVVEVRVGQLDAGGPPLPIEEFDLHPRPERLDHGVVVAVADRAYRGSSRSPWPLGEGPGCELTGRCG